MTRRILILLTTALAPVSAHAHVGHVAEVAGHAHWIGLAAAAGAAGLAALLWGQRGGKDDADGNGADGDRTDGDEAPDGAEDAA